MNFDSFPFFLFAVVFFSVWPLVRERTGARLLALAAFSLFFYGWSDPRYVLLLLVNGLVDYWAALAMAEHPAHRRAILIVSLSANLGILAAFKYVTFLTTNLNALLEALGAGALLPVVFAFPPPGISFYTFQSMSYTIDVYRGAIKPTRDAVHYFAFLALFPQLVAGPIVRATELLPHLLTWTRPSDSRLWEGLRLLVHGFFKKMAIADNLAPAIEHAAGGYHLVDSSVFWWVIVTLVGLQVYYDFAGYSDIARGLGKWIGYEFPVNFNHPFLATSMRQFWGRWNMTLTRWFRDYVYYSLPGSRGNWAASLRNLWLTMLLMGLWHGADWTFVYFGALHAFFLSFERVTKWPLHLSRLPFGRMICRGAVIVQLMIAGVFFRAPSLEASFHILDSMFGLRSFDTEALGWITFSLPFMAIAIAWELLVLAGLSIEALEKKRWFARIEPALLILMSVLAVFCRGPGTAFVYFQF